MNKIEYVGCFFDPQTILRVPIGNRQGPLYRTIATPHVTFIFAPREVPCSLFGRRVIVKAVGYGCDGQNEALQVEFLDLSPALQDLAAQISIPHITLSVAKGAKPFNSRHLDFRPIEPFLLEGTFGGMDLDGSLHTEAC